MDFDVVCISHFLFSSPIVYDILGIFLCAASSKISARMYSSFSLNTSLFLFSMYLIQNGLLLISLLPIKLSTNLGLDLNLHAQYYLQDAFFQMLCSWCEVRILSDTGQIYFFSIFLQISILFILVCFHS